MGSLPSGHVIELERLGNDKWSERNFVCQSQVCDITDINTILPIAYRIDISESITY